MKPSDPAVSEQSGFSFGIAWRTLFTALSFTLFGLGALILSFVVLPPIHLFSRSRELAQKRSRRAVRVGFRLFIWFMNTTGVLEYRIHDLRRIEPGSLIIANHPSLIDVIFTIANLPDTYCVVKQELGRNPFTRLILLATGYPTSQDPNRMIDDCTELLNRGARVLLFPEGTRTAPGRSPVFRRGAANIICRSKCQTIPLFLHISPPTLAKGEPWLQVPRSRVRYDLRFGAPLLPAALLDEGISDPLNARRCTQRLQTVFSEQLSNIMSATPGIDESDGKPADRH